MASKSQKRKGTGLIGLHSSGSKPLASSASETFSAEESDSATSALVTTPTLVSWWSGEAMRPLT